MTLPSVVEAVANLNEDFPWIVVMGPAEGEAIVKEHAAVGDVQPGN